MTYKVEYESLLSKELHVTVKDIIQMPIVIKDRMITELHQVIGTDAKELFVTEEQKFKVTPSEAQDSDWTWETFNGGMRILGKINPEFRPFDMEFWLK